MCFLNSVVVVTAVDDVEVATLKYSLVMPDSQLSYNSMGGEEYGVVYQICVLSRCT